MHSPSKTLQSKLSRLPGYLTVQMVRFFYKEKESVNAKVLKVGLRYPSFSLRKWLLASNLEPQWSFLFPSVLKDVKFPLMLDVYELCTTELQEKMLPIRSKFKEVEDKKLEKQQQKVSHKGFLCFIYCRLKKTISNTQQQCLYLCFSWPRSLTRQRRSNMKTSPSQMVCYVISSILKIFIVRISDYAMMIKCLSVLQTWAPTTAATMTCRRCSHTRAAAAHRVTTWAGSRGKKVGRRRAPQHVLVHETIRNMMFLLSSLPPVRRVVQVWRWQGQRGLSRGYPAAVWRRGLAYSICSTVRPPATGNTRRVARPQRPTPASKIAISKHCLCPCAVNLVSLSNLTTLTFVFVTNANAYKILSTFNWCGLWWKRRNRGRNSGLDSWQRFGAAVSLNVLYTLYIFNASDKVLI